MWETLYGMVTAYPIVCFIFIPVYFNLGITSVYQYIELRFKSRLVRCLASGTYVFRSILNLGVTVFTPTVALYTIIGFPIWMSLSFITAISIIFNLLGGLKAAITADVIQVMITIFVSAVIIIQSTILAGGVGNVYNENRDSGRLNFLNFTGDLTVRVDTTSAWIGQLFMSLSLFGCQQNFVQRYLSMKSIKDVTKYVKTYWDGRAIVWINFVQLQNADDEYSSHHCAVLAIMDCRNGNLFSLLRLWPAQVWLHKIRWRHPTVLHGRQILVHPRVDGNFFVNFVQQRFDSKRVESQLTGNRYVGRFSVTSAAI